MKSNENFDLDIDSFVDVIFLTDSLTEDLFLELIIKSVTRTQTITIIKINSNSILI